MKCARCGKEIAGEEIAFCPYCGEKILREKTPEQTDPRVEEWIRKALAVSSLPERKKILDQAKAECPDSPEIDWELLFIGHKDPKPPKGRLDFSIIKSWLLQIYRTPGEFSDEKRNAMRKELFEDPQLISVLEASGDPEGKMEEYLYRLCREYIEVFLEEDNRLMGNLFGFRLGRNKEERLARPVSEMVHRMEADEALTPERREQLSRIMRQAFETRKGGR